MTRRSHELELDNLRLRQENVELRALHLRSMEALKESSALLLKSRPPRPHIPVERKLLVAGQQLFRCAGDRSRCPCWRLNAGSFDESGFQVDHCPAWRDAYRNDRAVLQALCHSCHALKTRMEHLRDLESSRGDTEDAVDEGQ